MKVFLCISASKFLYRTTTLKVCKSKIKFIIKQWLLEQGFIFESKLKKFIKNKIPFIIPIFAISITAVYEVQIWLKEISTRNLCIVKNHRVPIKMSQRSKKIMEIVNVITTKSNLFLYFTLLAIRRIQNMCTNLSRILISLIIIGVFFVYISSVYYEYSFSLILTS